MDQLETLDLSQFLTGDESQRKEFSAKLLSTFMNKGFVKLVNHGLSAEYVLEGLRYVSFPESAFFFWNSLRFQYLEEIKKSWKTVENEWHIILTSSKNRELFRLPHKTKMTFAHPPRPNPHRGYSYVGQENISGVTGFEKGEEAPATRILDMKVPINLFNGL